ncbi:MAG: carbohydrate-binding family 9-like protein, partial [Planctomycetota bacterium]
KLTERDCVVYWDNDIELFLDPDGDTHEYYEVELNALNTLWDLIVTKPYRDDGHGVNAWDVRGIRTAVWVDGTLNDPSDTDRGWSVEMAIPWGPLRESERSAGPPAVGDVWRMNMSRVEWRAKVVDGKYVKETDPKTGKNLPEDNWSWSPQGLVAMHMPEMWGYLKFVERGLHAEIGIGGGGPSLPEIEWTLRRVYYAQKKHHGKHGKFAKTLRPLDLGKLRVDISLDATDHQFIAVARDPVAALVAPEKARLRVSIDHEGRLTRREEDAE